MLTAATLCNAATLHLSHACHMSTMRWRVYRNITLSPNQQPMRDCPRPAPIHHDYPITHRLPQPTLVTLFLIFRN